jgi:SAM-dependent methyltransferase
VSTAPSPPAAPPDAAAAQQLMQFTTGYILSTAVQIVTRLRIADRLAAGRRPAADLAHETGVNADALYRVLRLLASVGVFCEGDSKTFSHTEASSALRSGIPGSMHEMVLWLSDPFHLRVYADAMHAVTTGQPAADKTTGVPVFEYFARNPELSEIFNDAMTGFSAVVVPAALEAYDFSGIETLVDVAGGHGQVLLAILERYPAMNGVLADLEHVLAGAGPRIRDKGLENRCRTEVIDFFEAVPAGGDAYIMKHIIHDWDDDRAALILRNIRKAMKPGGRVILLDSVLLPANRPDFGKVIDLEMLMLPGGRERTEEEFRVLFARAGFGAPRVIPTQSPLSIIEAR